MEAVLWAAVFFETVGDDDCHPDVAVKQLEQMTHFLQQLSPTEQDAFRVFARGVAERDPRPDIAAVVRQVVDALLPEH